MDTAILAAVVLGGGPKTTVIQPGSADGQDTYISAVVTTTNFGTFELVIRSGASARNSLIKFDLSSIPPGSMIIRATLALTVGAQVAANGAFTINRILAANDGWTELGATWATKDGTNAWAGAAGCETSGTDYDATAIGTFSYTNGEAVGTVKTISLDTTEFALLLANNYGLVLRQSSGTAGNYTFYSSDNATPGNRPRLEVVHFP